MRPASKFPVLFLAVLLGAVATPALQFDSAMVDGRRFTIVKVLPGVEDLRLFYKDARGRNFGEFRAVDSSLPSGKRLAFAMNAGMYDKRFRPLGVFVDQGIQYRKLNLRSGYGNFFLQPNGVFLVARGKPKVVDTRSFRRYHRHVRLATQSGPLLLASGRIHPVFDSLSTSRLKRNAVGVRGDTAYFAISEDSVNFHETARLFRDVLRCRDALYLDGQISSLHAPELSRSDTLDTLVTMIGVIERTER